MSYSSYNYIPFLDTFGEADRLLADTTPIRGSDPVRYPLGRRSDSRKFSISKMGNGDIALHLYGQIAIVFHGNQTLTIGDPTGHRQWRWSSCDAYFICAVLGRYISGAWTDKGRLVFATRDEQKFVLPTKGTITLTYNSRSHTLVPIPASVPVQYTHRLNRQATNNIRARYGDFYRYMKGMIGVRKEVRTTKYSTWREEVVDEFYAVPISEQELLDVVPTVMQERHQYGGGKVNVRGRDPNCLMAENSPKDKPAKVAIRYEPAPTDEDPTAYKPVATTHNYDNWLAATKEFMSLISTPADNADQHEVFRQAFVWLAYFANGNPFYPKAFDAPVADLQKCIDEIVFKYHSEEVIERVPAKPNTVPGSKYLTWITRERD